MVGVAATIAAAVRRRAASHGLPLSGHQDDPSRWLAVTVNLTPDDSRPLELPEPLRAWGEAIEVRTSPAPGDRGTELAVRLRDPYTQTLPSGLPDALAQDLDGTTAVEKLRSALRRAKQVIETGEVLRADEPGTTEATALNAPLRAVTSISGAEGRL
ncbi:hypothetical protein KIH74_07020 [Kineosporia sp. J2-2]|uniref:Uncharacterized protein n=1 Tax=Kineosporia corallincola TaxID=2835133 RepID=A0ABS5TC63_9ACTN|nr:hypothetical protein [Kineosporia corallincola]MBT0768672.1 hypothetical protein [Kineosporia corallincola]